MRNKIMIATLSTLFLVVGLIFILTTDNPSQNTMTTPSASQQTTSNPQGPTHNIQNDKNIEECYKRVQDSEASQQIINDGLKSCREKYQ